MQPYLFAVCAAGAESALKRSVARAQPDLRAAFQRPGFVTFKSNSVDAKVASFLVRVSGRCLGRSAEPVAAAVAALSDAGIRRLHVYPRMPGFQDEADELERQIRQAGADIAASALAEPGERVLDAIVVDPNVVWLGTHEQGRDQLRYPGGSFPKPLPEGAPSRAYLKILEVIERFGLNFSAGHHVLEIGCSPGGTVLALLQRGLEVTGIDANEVAPQVGGHARFRHIQASARAVVESDLPRSIDWLLVDVNRDPGTALKLLGRIQELGGRPRCGAVVTMKLASWHKADRVPGWLQELRALGFANVEAAQLSSHGQECVAVAMR